MCTATRVRRHLLAFIALSSFAAAELPSVMDTDLGTWSYADVTVLSTDFATSLGRNFTVWGTLWIGEQAFNATSAHHPQPTLGLANHHDAPVPFASLKHWSPGSPLYQMGFAVTAVGAADGEELPLVDSEVTLWDDTWLACSNDGEDVFVDLADDGAYRQVDCGVEGWKVRLGFQFVRGSRYDSSVVAGRTERSPSA